MKPPVLLSCDILRPYEEFSVSADQSLMLYSDDSLYARSFIPDKLLRKKRMPRTASCIFLSSVTLLAALLNAAQRQEVLGVASLLSGFAFGGFQGVVPAITSEIFGLQNFATNYAMVQLGPAAGKAFPLGRRHCHA